MKDLTSPRLMWLKAALFCFIGFVATGLLLLDQPTLKNALLLVLAIWGFCRAYYFAFYVVEHYVDPGFKFAGLGSFLAYMMRPRPQMRSRSNTAKAPTRPSRDD